MQAFPCHAFDYLFKPFEEKRLYKTLNEALKVLPENSPYLDIVCDKHTHSVFLSEILYILSDSNYCIVGLKDKEYRTRASFSDFTSKVKDAPEFFTISRGIMVNLDNVISIDKTDCILINQEVFPVSRRKHEEAEKALLKENLNLKAEVLKVGHHGSSTSSKEDFIKAVRPHYAAISVGRDNLFGHPHSETLSVLEYVGARIYRTDLDGDISFYIENEKIIPKTEK